MPHFSNMNTLNNTFTKFLYCKNHCNNDTCKNKNSNKNYCKKCGQSKSTNCYCKYLRNN